MGAARIEAIGLSKSFAGPPLFANLSFIFGEGVHAVVGKNGTGKSTLLKILAGLLRPGAGNVRIEVGGKELSADDRRAGVGWSAPDLAFYPELTAVENLAFFRRAAGFAARAGDLEARLDAVGLGGAAGPVEHFSSGMRQRLRIAFAFLLDPPVVILDEPFTALDSEGRFAVAEFVASAAGRGPVVLAATEISELPGADEVIELGARHP